MTTVLDVMPAASRLAARIAGLGRRAAVGTAFLAGALMTAGQAPISQAWVLFLALPVLVWLVDGSATSRRAALLGWAAGFGYFLTGLFWVGQAFLVEAERFAWMMPFAVTLLPAGLALFWAVAFALARRFWRPERWTRALVLALALTLLEYARGHALTGFPWALAAYAWVETPVMQAVAWIGPWGLTLLSLALAPLPALAMIERGGARIAGVITLALLAGTWTAGALRLAAPEPAPPGPVLRIVQPNATQRLKWQPEHAARFYAYLLEATAAAPDPALGPPAAAIWPETAVTFLPAYHPEKLREIAAAAAGRPVLLGALHGVRTRSGDRWFNTLTTVLAGGRLGPRYAKHHLVPFGEYLPLASVLGRLGLTQLVQQTGFVAGEGPMLMEVPGLPPFSPLICYEIIFPGEVVPPGRRPAWLLQITNDAWFGRWGGPQQHLAQARSRAIEQGLPVIRAANTGVSAVIDARGRILQALPLETRGHIDASLPGALPPTLYARTGDLPALIVLVAGLFAIARRHPRHS